MLSISSARPGRWTPPPNPFASSTKTSLQALLLVAKVTGWSRAELFDLDVAEFNVYLETALRLHGVDPGTHVTVPAPAEADRGKLTAQEEAVLARVKARR